MLHLSEIAIKQLVAGISGKYVHGDKASIGIVTIEKGSILPLHHHPHEQITYILEGSLDMEIGGEQFLLTQGCFHVIPSNMPHSAIAHEACTVIDIFSPVREDYK